MDRNHKLEQAAEFVTAAAVLIAIYWLATSVTRGWVSWAMGVPALAIIGITAIVRLNDITAVGKRWFVRRLGMILVGMSAVTLITAPILGYAGSFPSWRSVLLYWGVALTWLTTPNMPPWWKYISGGYRLSKEQQG